MSRASLPSGRASRGTEGKGVSWLCYNLSMENPLLRSIVNGLKDYLPGKNPTEPGVIKLASNENPFGPSPAALAAIKQEASRLQMYPDQKSGALRAALALKTSLPEDNFICGNGSDDIMQIIAAAYLNPGEKVVVSENSFSVYELVTKLFGGELVKVPLKNFQQDLGAIAAAVDTKTKIVFLTNPHNPTGSYLSKVALESFLKKLPPTVLVVIDEAYAEFAEAPDFAYGFDQVRSGANVVVLRTFSKFYGLAGLRVGYGVGPAELIAPLFKTKMPFNVNRLAQAAAVAALDDVEFLTKTAANNRQGKKYLYQALEKLGLKYLPTEANFIFIGLQIPADELFLKLLKEKIIIRPLTSFGLPEAIRVSIGTEQENARLIAGLQKTLI